MPADYMKTIDTLYLIDDDDTYQFIVEKTLNSLNLVNSIKIFSNGKAAIDFLEATIHDIDQIPDVILLDLTMPIMDGWQFLEQYLRFRPRIGKKVVIYVISSSIDPRDMQRAKSISEVTDYIVKPLTKTKLISMLHESLKS
ncbi:Response regulator receiver domain-containing protein [Flagellimonas taeanensis]|uniref:Response regulator receiver domain-containing protein n=2 Tax=Flagellimonas taeanensis TaxID=1005926 RepID=A0A1M6UWA1_9FLAO|nr:Response regulator receiver domain-containing protein [Allomuricauda taeanensis]SHK73527.1 Response regulator receiver domain-containing protein [Allomuricauda taeanensis]